MRLHRFSTATTLYWCFFAIMMLKLFLKTLFPLFHTFQSPSTHLSMLQNVDIPFLLPFSYFCCIYHIYFISQDSLYMSTTKIQSSHVYILNSSRVSSLCHRFSRCYLHRRLGMHKKYEEQKMTAPTSPRHIF